MEAQFDVQILTVISGVLIPLIVGLIAKEVTSSSVKAILNALLSAIAGGIAAAIDAGGAIEDWRVWLFHIALTWVVSIATYYGLWKPTGVAPKVNHATGRFGV